MYFVKYQPLKQKLAERSLSDKEALPYLLIFTVLTVFVTSVPLYDNFNNWDVLTSILSIALAILGIIYAYKKNGGEEGYDFIQKYVVLGWVVFIRCFLVFLPIMVLCLIIGEYFNFISLDESNVFDVVIQCSFEIVLYQRIGKNIKDTIKKNS